MQIKRHLSLVLALLTLVSNTGLAFSLHFCSGRLACVNTVLVKSPANSCCEASHKKCCGNRIVSFKKTSENTITKPVSFDSSFEITYQAPQKFVLGVVDAPMTTKATILHSGSHSPPLYLLYSQYIFYA